MTGVIVPDPDLFDLSQRDLFGRRVAKATVTHHRRAHHSNTWTAPEGEE